MSTWATPSAFLLFIPLALFLGWMLWRSRKKRPTLLFSGIKPFKSVPRPVRSRLWWFSAVLQALGIALAILALARPQRADTKVKRNVEGIDIMIAFDISDSMLIEDMSNGKNRLETAKGVIEKFIKGRVSDRIGLVVFSGESYTRVPLTLDYPLLLKSVAGVQTSQNIKMGTAIGVALANAVARLKDSTAKSRVVIFLTDGENNTGTIDPETALEIAKGYGIKIYSIGVGKDGEAKLPVIVEDAFGRQIKRYRPIHSSINEKLLSRFADETGGKFWRATNGKALQQVFNDIDHLEKTKIEVNQYTKYAELFPPYLRWAILIYVLALLAGYTILRRGP